MVRRPPRLTPTVTLCPYTTLCRSLDRPEKVKRMVLMGPGGSVPMFSQFPTEAIKTLLFFYDGPGPSIQRLRGFVKDFVFDPSQITEELLEGRMKTALQPHIVETPPMRPDPEALMETGRASWRERGWRYGGIVEVAG